jgi:hypothetical protein
MKKISFIAAIFFSAWLSSHTLFWAKEDLNDLQMTVRLMVALFFVLFGSYGLYAEKLWKQFKSLGKTENLCVEANYYVRKKGFFGRVFLFPFIKVNSSNSFVVAFLGALTWVVIISFLIKAFAP